VPLGIVTALGVFVAYFAATIFLTWPLAAMASTRLPHPLMTARVDVALLAWGLAYASRALAWWDGPPAGIYHPTPWSLFYGETGFGALPHFAPVFLATGNPALATNVVFLSGVALTAGAIHAVAHHWTRSHLAGVVAGATFLATPWTLWAWVPAAPNYAVLQYLPFVIVLASRGPTSWRSTVGLGALLALQGLASAYVAAAAMAPLAALAAARVIRRATRPTGLRLLAALGLAGVVLGAAWYGHVLVQSENPLLGHQSMYAGMGLTSTRLPEQIFQMRRPAALTLVSWTVIACGGLFHVLALRRRGGAAAAAWKHCGLWLLVGVYLSCGPYVRWRGDSYLMPHAILSPLLAPLRAQDRFGIATLVAGSILAGVAFSQCTTAFSVRYRRVAATVLAAAVLGALHGSYMRPLAPILRTLDPAEPYPTVSAPPATGPIAAALARAGGPVLELPIGPNVTPHAMAMYRAIHHRRPLLNGYHGYWPAEFPARMALACDLPDPRALAELHRTTGVEHVVVHLASLYAARRTRFPPPYGCPPNPLWDEAPRGAELQRWLGMPPAVLEVVAKDGNDVLFRIVPPGDAAQPSLSQR
jgi:hypothetical protein